MYPLSLSGSDRTLKSMMYWICTHSFLKKEFRVFTSAVCLSCVWWDFRNWRRQVGVVFLKKRNESAQNWLFSAATSATRETVYFPCGWICLSTAKRKNTTIWRLQLVCLSFKGSGRMYCGYIPAKFLLQFLMCAISQIIAIWKNPSLFPSKRSNLTVVCSVTDYSDSIYSLGVRIMSTFCNNCTRCGQWTSKFTRSIPIHTSGYINRNIQKREISCSEKKSKETT